MPCVYVYIVAFSFIDGNNFCIYDMVYFSLYLKMKYEKKSDIKPRELSVLNIVFLPTK